MAVVDQEATSFDTSGVRVEVPPYMAQIVATISHLARQSPHINQRSGVSVRLSVTNYETMVASAVRRALRLQEPEAVPRVSDLDALVSSTSGKVEIETIDEGRDGQVVDRLIQLAVLNVFKASVPPERLREAVADFDAEDSRVVHTGDDIAAAQFVEVLGQLPALESVVLGLAGEESPAAVASATEFVLEGLHLSKRLNKDAAGGRATYRAR